MEEDKNGAQENHAKEEIVLNVEEEDDDGNDDKKEKELTEQVLLDDCEVESNNQIRGNAGGDGEKCNHDNKQPIADEERATGVPIDRGWAWMIVLGCFGVHVIVVGAIKSYGVLYVVFKDKYQPSAKALSIVTSLPLALMFGLGILANRLVMIFSARSVVIAGGFLICLSFIFTSVMPEFGGVIVTFGLIGGFGCCLTYAPSIVMVGRHFKKYRSLANGIAVAGAGVGSFAFPNLIRFMLKEFGLQGCLLILAGVLLNVVVCGMLYRPWSSYAKAPNLSVIQKFEEVPTNVQDNFERCPNGDESNLLGAKQMDNDTTKISSVHNLECYSASLQALNDLQHFRNEKLSISEESKFTDESGPQQPSKQKLSCLRNFKLLDWSLLINPVFLIYCGAVFLATPGYAAIFMTLPDHAESNGLDRDASALITSIIGIADMTGRLVFGWFFDLNFVSKSWGYVIAIAVTGILNIALPWLKTFSALVAYASIFGLFSGSFVTLTPVLLAEELGTERLGDSFGLTLLFMAIAVLTGPVICGSLKDATGSWDAAFYVLGVLSLIGATLPLFRSHARRWADAQEKKRQAAQ